MATDIIFGVAYALNSTEIDSVPGQISTPYLTVIVAKDSRIHNDRPSILHEYLYSVMRRF